MQATIHNEFLTLTVDTHGAEAVSLKNAAGEEMLWQADPAIWKRHAPILFPWTGKLVDGTFTAKGLKTECKDGKLVITQEGAKKKFVNKVEQITFSGDYANKVHQPVLYITERAVFELRPEGVTLVEIAPGIDLQTQVLDQMEFMPKIADDLKLMDERIFREELMGLAND